MKNIEKYKDEILKEYQKDYDNQSFMCILHYLRNADDCSQTDCIECLKRSLDWLEQEYQKHITLTDGEKAILKNLPKNIEWIARDQNGRLYLYYKKPQKELAVWDSDWMECDFAPYYHLFKFIKWEDEEPYNIDELLKQNGVER